jgi:hypothetical protein
LSVSLNDRRLLARQEGFRGMQTFLGIIEQLFCIRIKRSLFVGIFGGIFFLNLIQTDLWRCVTYSDPDHISTPTCTGNQLRGQSSTQVLMIVSVFSGIIRSSESNQLSAAFCSPENSTYVIPKRFYCNK